MDDPIFYKNKYNRKLYTQSNPHVNSSIHQKNFIQEVYSQFGSCSWRFVWVLINSIKPNRARTDSKLILEICENIRVVNIDRDIAEFSE